MSQATQPNAQNATQQEEYMMEETPAPKPRFIPGAPRGRTYRRTSGHWTTNAEGNVAWIPSSPNMESPHMMNYKQLKSLRNMRRFAPTFTRNKVTKTKMINPRRILKRRTFKKINPNRK